MKSYLVKLDSKENITDKIYSNKSQIRNINCQTVI